MITFDILRKFPAVRAEYRRVKRLGHSVEHLEVVDRDFRRTERGAWVRGTVVASGRCDACGGNFTVERDCRSDDPDRIVVTGSVLTTECIE